MDSVRERLNTPEKVEYILSIMRMVDVDSIDRLLTNEDGDCVENGALIADTAPSLEELIIEKESNNTLLNIINTLRPREQVVLKLRYGLEDGNRRTLEEVGKIYQLTRERVRQIERIALKKLRLKLLNKGIRSSNDL